MNKKSIANRHNEDYEISTVILDEESLLEEESNEKLDFGFIKKYLDDFNKANDLPNGHYQMEIEDIKLGKSPNGTKYCRWELKIENSGQYDGVIVHRQNTLTENESSANQFFSDLKSCGVRIQSDEDINEAYLRKNLVGKKIPVQVFNHNGMPQYYIKIPVGK